MLTKLSFSLFGFSGFSGLFGLMEKGIVLIISLARYRSRTQRAQSKKVLRLDSVAVKTKKTRETKETRKTK